ncbi:putative ABC transporter permease [Neobacillus dielmonensis]|uniref:putative ABC transporter permease n=1 Tax=Neobacillus dielmonensis TaxID=1347369 RepID=UPI0005A8EEA2|nr:putative ABC transporter permease [Neobacillus dielmonensis]
MNNIQFIDIFHIEGVAAILFYFMVYSFFGWMLENSFNLVTKGKFLKDNFLYGPFKPMYGIAPLLLVLLIRPGLHWGLAVLLCLVIPTVVEYISGTLLGKLFNRQWWDYSDMPLQLHGHICLPYSVCWTLLSLLFVKWIHPAVASFYLSVHPFWTWVWSAVGLYFLADLALTVRRHASTILVAEEIQPD